MSDELAAKGKQPASVEREESPASASNQPAWRQASYSDLMIQTGLEGMPEGLLLGIQGSRYRRVIARILFSHSFRTFISACICSTLLLMWLETDSRARGEVPLWLDVTNILLLIVYAVEIIMRLLMEEKYFFSAAWNCFDLSIVTIDLAVWLVTPFLATGSYAWIRVFRVLRAFRVARVLRLVLIFRELYMIVFGMVSIGKALFWASGLMLLVLSMCSIIAVEVLHPLMDDLIQSGAFDHCGRCSRSFDSVWKTTLLWIQTLVAGDSWGQTALPVIDAHPWAAIIFLTVLVISQLGLLNLISTVMLDTAMDCRSNDQERILAEKQREMMKAFDALREICAQLDEDASGELTLGEILKGYKDHKDFRATLQMMDVAAEDLQTVFQLMDQDGSGRVSYEEFIQQLHKMRTSDSHTLLVFIKHHVQTLQGEVSVLIRDLHKEAQEDIKALREGLEGHGHMLRSMSTTVQETARATNVVNTRVTNAAFALPEDIEEDKEECKGEDAGYEVADCESQLMLSKVNSIKNVGEPKEKEPMPASKRASANELKETSSKSDSAADSALTPPIPGESQKPLRAPKSESACDAALASPTEAELQKPLRASKSDSANAPKKPEHASKTQSTNDAALSATIQADLQKLASKMDLLLKQVQLTGVPLEEEKHESKDGTVMKHQKLAASNMKGVQSNMRLLSADLDVMDSVIGAELQHGLQSQLLDRLDSIRKDIRADLDDLRQEIMQVLRESSRFDRDGAPRSITDVKDMDYMPLVAQPESNRRLSHAKAASPWQCCAAPPRPKVRGILG